jgi:hypothetical protein
LHLVGGYPPDCLDQLSVVDLVAGELGDVDEVAPAGVGGAALEGGDELLCEDELYAVAAEAEGRVAEEPWDVDLAVDPRSVSQPG